MKARRKHASPFTLLGILFLLCAAASFAACSLSPVESNGIDGQSDTGASGSTTGTLTVRNSSAIADRAVLRVAAGGDAKVELAEGVNEAVGYLYLDGEMRRAGTYGSTGSAAAHKDDGVFSGTGVLTVLYDTSGTVIMLR